jgi:lipoprotein-anchoring transpeptidase ErfK/SrfK
VAQSLFPFTIPSAVPLSLSPEAPVCLPPDVDPNYLPPDVDPNYLPPDADPNYSTLAGFDKDVNMSLTTHREVNDPTGEPPGTVTINTRLRKLFLSLGDGRAIEYGIGVGRQGFAWKGVAEVGRKAFWPGWTPSPEMFARQPGLPDHMDGGMENPLGARALYLFQGKKDTLFRIHGTNEPKSIGKAVSCGCIRMMDSDVIDLYGRVAKGTRVVVLEAGAPDVSPLTRLISSSSL